MKILKLTAENVKKLTAVEVTPDGNVVIIGGKNRAGKSAVLDAIMFALAGKKAIAEKPLRTGAKSGKIVLQLDGCEEKSLSPLTVTRTFSEDGKSQLEIKTDDGFKAPSPQTILDDLCGRGLAFDPMGFVGMSPKEQTDALRELVGLDFTEHDAVHKRLFDQRTLINRDSKALKARVDGMTKHADAPAAPVSVSQLMEELQLREAINRINGERRQELVNARRLGSDMAERFVTARDRVAELKQLVVEAEAEADRRAKECERHSEAIDALRIEVEALQDSPVDIVREQIAGAEAVNAKVRGNAAIATLEAELKTFEDKSTTLTTRLKELDDAKSKQMAEAKWPIDGLGFDDTGVTLNGLPFEQASQEEQIQVAVSMGIAMNPELRVVLVRNGSLIDEERFVEFCKMANDKDIQVWVERVGTADDCSVIIEDGHVKVTEPETVEA